MSFLLSPLHFRAEPRPMSKLSRHILRQRSDILPAQSQMSPAVRSTIPGRPRYNSTIVTPGFSLL